MWILVMLLLAQSGPRVDTYPQPFAGREACEAALMANQANMEQMLAKAKIQGKFTLKCLEWDGVAEKAE